MLSGAEIRRQDIVILAATADVGAHLQPNGVDLSLDAIWEFAEQGALGVDDADRYRPASAELQFDRHGWIQLQAGTYGVRYGERVTLPNDCGALCFPRSSLLRMGVHVPTAVWDAGYVGRGEGLLIVGNTHGARLQRGARIAQLVVFKLSEPVAAGYSGHYQHENT